MSTGPYLIGQNAWWQAPDTGSSWGTSIWTLIKNAGVNVVRIGGHTYDQALPQWSSSGQITSFLGWIDQVFTIGAVPIVQVSRYMLDSGGKNIVVGDPATIAKNAKALVQTVNDPGRPNRVQYWSIGNEPDYSDPPGGSYDPQSIATNVASYVTQAAYAMRDADPSIKIYAPDASLFNTTIYGYWLGGDTDITGQDSKGRYYIDGVTFHRYPFKYPYRPSPGDPLWYRTDVLNELHTQFPLVLINLLNLLSAANQKNGRVGATALQWGLTEFNICSSNQPANTPSDCSVSSFLNGQFFAEYISQGMKNGAQFFTAWSVDESFGDSGSNDLGFLNGDAIAHPSAVTPRSSYYHMQMIATLQGTLLSSTSSQFLVRVTSTINNGKVTVMLLNEDTADHSYILRVHSDVLPALAEAQAEIAASTDTQIDVGTGQYSYPYSNVIANQSSVVLIFKLPQGYPGSQQFLLETITYSLVNDQQNQPPVVYQPPPPES